MPKFTIKQGHHYHGIPPLPFLPWIGKLEMARAVTFDANCEYDSAPYNADDVNKLFGLSFGFGGVHHNSARFGWRWSKSAQCIELLAYCYANGVRNQDAQLRFPVLSRVQPGELVHCHISYLKNSLDSGARFEFSVVRPLISNTILSSVPAPAGLPDYGLIHGFYFGGELTAPHEVSATIERI